MKNIAIAFILGVSLIVSAALAKRGMENANKRSPVEAYSLYGYEGVLYRLNNVNGQLDVLVPSNEAALLFPVGSIQFPNAKDKLTDEQQKSFSQNIRIISQYIQGERVRSLGLAREGAQPQEAVPGK